MNVGLNVGLFGSRFLKAKTGFIFLALIGLGVQIVIDQSLENIICSLTASICSIMLAVYVFRPFQWSLYPISSIVLIGFAITQCLGPLLFTALEFHPITFNLKVPEQVFLNAFLCTLVLILAHIIYRKNSALQKLRFSVTNLLKTKLSIFKPLSRIQVIVIGVFGAVATVFTYWFQGFGVETPILKFVQGFIPYAYVPLVLVLKPLQNRLESIKRADWVINIVFFLIIVVVSVGRNSRGGFVRPILIYLIGIGLMWLYGKIKIKFSQVIAVLLAVYFVLPLVSDLATAMVLTRALRGDISAVELISETINRVGDRQAIDQFRESGFDDSLTRDWDETYVSNLFLARFANLKFADNALEISENLSDSEKTTFQYFMFGRLISILPTPVLDFLSVPAALKEEVNSQSIGDQLYFLGSGDGFAIGGFRTGHFYGSGLVMFGWFYLPILLFLIIPFFILNDALISQQDNNSLSLSNNLNEELDEKIPFFSTVAIINLSFFIQQGSSESILDYLTFVIRVFPQQIILFFILLKLSALISKFYKVKN